MPVYIKTQVGDIISFDAVTSYNQDYNSKVTEHPLESGANVTDHIIKENLKLSISGVFSDYSPSNDFEFFNFEKANVDQESDTPEFKSSNIVNDRRADPITVTDSFAGDRDITGSNYLIEAQSSIKSKTDLVKKKLVDIQRAGETVTLFEIDGRVLKSDSYFPNAIITSVSFSEDDSSGDALYVKIQATIVTFANTESVVVDTEKNKQLKAAATNRVTGALPAKQDKEQLESVTVKLLKDFGNNEDITEELGY